MKVWTTKDGRRIPLHEMTDDHVLNAMRFLARAHRRYVDSIVFFGIPEAIGEMARVAAEQEVTDAMDSAVDDLYPIYADLVLEATRRGLVKDVPDDPGDYMDDEPSGGPP